MGEQPLSMIVCRLKSRLVAQVGVSAPGALLKCSLSFVRVVSLP